MKGLKNYFEKISEEIQIPFKITEKDGTIIANFLKVGNYKLVSTKININLEELLITTYEEYSNCIKLLKYVLMQELVSAVKSKEEIIIDILKGKEHSSDVINQVIKYKPFTLIVIYLNNKHEEAIKLLEKTHLNEESIIVRQEEYIILISNNDIKQEIISDIIESLKKNISNECYASYCKIDNYPELKGKFEYLKMNIQICLKYNLENKVYKENSLLLEKIIQNVNRSETMRIYKQYNDIFSKLDKDLIKTIDVFFSEGLRISESADKLFIHRNTLFYRIDKIKKIINYDISNFNEAIEFKILFLIWREVSYNQKFS